MMTNAKIATAVVGGYLLGRTKKGKLALSLGMMLAGRKMSLNPQDLARTVAGSPLLSGLSDQVRKDLLEGTKSAAGSALEARMNSLADSLHERSAALEGDDEDRGEEDEPDADREDDDGAEGAGQEPEPEPDPDPEPERKPARAARKKTAGTARKAAGSSTRTTKKTAKTAKTAGTTRSRAAKTARGGGDE
jgi:hypothetical protein